MSPKIKDAIGLAALGLLVALPGLGDCDLVTDEAKDALNVAYPHPPLVRTAMHLMVRLFGRVEWAPRLPSVLLGAAAVGLVYLILREIGVRRGLAALATGVFLLLPPHLTWSRTAFLSPATETAWLLALLGFAMVERRPGDRRGPVIAAAGVILGSWANLQAVLLYPACFIFLWRHRTNIWRDGVGKIASLAALVASPLLLTAYVLSQRATREDFGRFLGGSASSGGPAHLGWVTTTPLGGLALASVIAAAAYVGHVRAGTTKRAAALDAAAVTVPMLLVLCLWSPAPYYAPYFAATGGLLAVALLTRLPGRIATAALALAVLVLLARLPATLRHPEPRTFFKEHAAEINSAVAHEPALGVLGPFGYQVNYYVKTPVAAGVLAAEVGAEHFLVLAPERLSSEEKDFLNNNLVLVFETPEGSFYRLRTER